MTTPTTRRHPRTTDDAFGGASYAGAITTPSGDVIGFHAAQPACALDKRNQGRKACPAPARCVIPLDGSLLARIYRALRWMRLRGPRV